MDELRPMTTLRVVEGIPKWNLGTSIFLVSLNFGSHCHMLILSN